ncbi:GlxA family transcriptional regulator [Rhizobium sp. S95]|uniref:GlxA family transcriptional regulator n=1 Tax=Ciceribacter sichuanensis TaxID=2949647 RepID=A0AAJ1BUU4_9HYPH|nr:MULTISPECIES: GlxA family transcriptional regulator [unclassified Ciceribacter]MCM2399023.1 GlxA family transcriptional regulator [Ciceribacter sp. S95]MCO5956771.1 GlxA family transcriptional regulator [Ciceribacter sp. S101]
MAEDPIQTTEFDILVVPETNLILVASVIEPLRVANRVSGLDLYHWRIMSPDGLAIETKSRIPVPVDAVFRPENETTPLFVLSSHNWRRYATSALKTLLAKSARHRSVVAGIESGTWLLAETALLDGFSATSHWEDYEEFSSSYPQVRTVRERYVIDGKRITTGGSLPTLDLMLELIRRRHGYSMALEVSRQFIYEQGGTPGDAAAMPSTGSVRLADPRVSHAMRLMEEHIEQPLTLARLARRVGVSDRYLQSLFRETIGAPPHVHYLALRLNAARRKVIETRLAFADIAALTGFNSASAFARSYRAHFRESASDTRRRLRPGSGLVA